MTDYLYYDEEIFGTIGHTDLNSAQKERLNRRLKDLCPRKQAFVRYSLYRSDSARVIMHIHSSASHDLYPVIHYLT